MPLITSQLLKKHQSAETVFPEFHINFELAQEAVEHVKSLNIRAYTELGISFSEFKKRQEECALMRGAHGSFDLQSKADLTKIANFSKLLTIGNCHEQAIIAFLFLSEHRLVVKHQIRVEVCIIKDGDHRFVVIGLNPDAGTDFREWNKDAVVCDPWAGSYFSVADISGCLYGYKFCNAPEPNMVTLFDPSCQSLVVQTVTVDGVCGATSVADIVSRQATEGSVDAAPTVATTMQNTLRDTALSIFRGFAHRNATDIIQIMAARKFAEFLSSFASSGGCAVTAQPSSSSLFSRVDSSSFFASRVSDQFDSPSLSQ